MANIVSDPAAGTEFVAPRTQLFMMISEPPVVWPGLGTAGGAQLVSRVKTPLCTE